ncbi:MAG: site-2 protease family protein [Candidatus Eremiobacteraeota bacterium]|nr:site-2 protease family protein [Candidatus Eremiobacteraeota bacterium]
MEDFSIIAYAFGFLVFVYCAMLVATLQALMRVRLKRGTCSMGDPAVIPPPVASVFAPYGEKLLNWGFVHSHFILVDSPFVNRFSEKWGSVYLHHGEQSAAFLYPSDLPDRNAPCSVEFTTLFENRERLVTVNGSSHRMIGTMPLTVIRDPWADTLRAQWDAHQEELRKKPGMPREEAPEESVVSYGEFLSEYIDHLLQIRWIIPAEDGSFRLSFMAALRTAFTMMAGEGKAAQMRKAMKLCKKEDLIDIDVPVELEVEAYRRMNDFSEGKSMGRLTKLILLVVSVAFFGLSFHYSLSLLSLLILIGVLFVHEMGHYVAMRLFHYRDVKVFFIPFLGAVTMGMQKEPKPMEKIVVSFMGPVPGIIAGLLLCAVPSPPELMKETVLMLLVINYLNLLPLMPLDGGQIFNLMMARFPYLQAIFQIVSAVILSVVFGILLKTPLLLIIGAVLAMNGFLRIPACTLLKKLRANVAQYGGDLKESGLVKEIFLLMKEKPYDSMLFQRKYQTVKGIADTYINELPGVLLICLTLLFYLFLFALPVVILMMKIFLRH